MFEKKDRLNKEFVSFERKIGKNQIWFNSLPEKKRWDLFFRWKSCKWSAKKSSNDYSPSLRNFIYICQKEPYFRVLKSVMRDKQINIILE